MDKPTSTQIVTKLLDRKDKKSLGNLLLYLHARWIEEQHYEPFSDYITYMKNVLKKYAPKRTKFIDFSNGLTDNNAIQLSLTIRLLGAADEVKITVSKGLLNWCLVQPTLP
jgi:hypothetical protein